MTKVEIEFSEVSELVDLKHKLIAENEALKDKLNNAENELHLANVKIENALYLCEIYDTDLEKARQQIENYSEEVDRLVMLSVKKEVEDEQSSTVSSVQAVAKIESKDDLKEVLQDEHMSLQLSLYTQEKECYSYEDMKALDETKETINKISNALETYNYSEMLKTLRAL